MNRIDRIRALPPNAGDIGVQKKIVCPACKQLVLVGGPHEGQWIVQVHSPNDDPTIICPGTNQRITASPNR